MPGAAAIVGGPAAEVLSAGDWSADAIVRIQSMTKIVTATAALRLVEAGRVDLDASVVPWLPELADRQVLRAPDAELDETAPAAHDITLRHLLTNASGYGMQIQPTPLARAMTENGTEAGPEPPTFGADEWLRRLADLPLAFQPGEGWRYHHSFGLLGILIARLTGRALHEHLVEDLFGPLGLPDTGLWVPEGKLDRLPAAYRPDEAGLVETEPAGGGFYAGPPPFDIHHGELVSTARDFHRFVCALPDLLSAEHVQQLRTDQIPDAAKSADDFFPGFWDGMGWGFGVGVQTVGPHAGRFGWSGGQGTDFYVDQDGTVAVLLTQVEMGTEMWQLFADFMALRPR
jgi:CubicO group peptidase (beta-lactamase class C family)